jgi:cytochrome c556
MKTLQILILALAATVFSGGASAQFAKPEDAIKYRKSALTVMATHFGRINAMVSGKAPFDAKAAADNAAVAENLSKLPWAAFGEGTDKGDTKAKAEIWKDSAKFHDGADKLQADLAKLTVAAKSGNFESVKTAFTAAAGQCKGCHDNFKDK